jgi:hypothetical protein
LKAIGIAIAIAIAMAIAMAMAIAGVSLLVTTACVSPSPSRSPSLTYFDPRTIKVGDTVAGLRVIESTLQRNEGSPRGYIGSVKFKGEVELRGGYSAHFDYPEVREPCFWVDRADWKKLPRVKAETRIVWFCFRNEEAAIDKLGALSKDTVKSVIVIDNYTTHLFETDAWDQVDLVRVVSLSH